jgi:hypothetical protein
MAETTVVYWLFDHNCICPRLHGYVGITADLPKRIAQHREKGRRKAVEFRVVVLFQGTKAECLVLERQLRPGYGIGWNLARGGWYPKDQKSPETRAKMAVAARGRALTAETRSKISAAKKKAEVRTKGFAGRAHSQEQRARWGQQRKGNTNWKRRQPYSLETRRKISEASKQYWSSDDARETGSKIAKAIWASEKGNEMRMALVQRNKQRTIERRL